MKEQIWFFLHTPFVPSQIFQALPRAAELLDALCACDVIDFHTQGYRDSYLQCVTELDRAVGDVNGWYSEGD